MNNTRDQLAAENTQALQHLADLTHDFDAVVAASRDTNADDEHDPEGATIAFERSQIEALVRQAKQHLEEIDAAVKRLDAGTTEHAKRAEPRSARIGSKPGLRQESASCAPLRNELEDGAPSCGGPTDIAVHLPECEPRLCPLASSTTVPGVPTALPGETRRVIVVGAGIAGLTVANALTAAGVDCVVVEARDRIGGRLQTVEIDGHVADLGGAWIHHPDGNVLTDWLEFASVPWIVDPTGTRFTGADLGERRQLTSEELADVGYAVFKPVTQRVLADEAEDRPDRSAAEAVDEYLADAVHPAPSATGCVS